MIKNSVCFIGHRNIEKTEKLKLKLFEIIKNLIINEKVDTFLFGSKSRFNDLCYELVTELKEKHPNIKRIYVRAEYQNINDDYKQYLLNYFEETYYPKSLIGAGKAIYVKRNFEMINTCRFCVIYYNESELPTNRKSGTKTALDYAKKSKKEIIMVWTLNGL